MPQIEKNIRTNSQAKRKILTGIEPYFEKVSAERGNPDKSSDSRISGFELFGLFTADVIHLKSIFVR